MNEFMNTNVPFGTPYVRIALSHEYEDIQYICISFLETNADFGIYVQCGELSCSKLCKIAEGNLTEIVVDVTTQNQKISITANRCIATKEYEVFVETLV